jgi:hypothetical protein
MYGCTILNEMLQVLQKDEDLQAHLNDKPSDNASDNTSSNQKSGEIFTLI